MYMKLCALYFVDKGVFKATFTLTDFCLGINFFKA